MNNNTNSFPCRGLIIYDHDETIPSVTLPMNLKFSCQQSNIHYQTKPSIGIESLFAKTSSYNQDIYSDVFESILIPEMSDNQSTQTQSFSRSHYSSTNNENY
jgi:hypothetical protein